MQLSNAPYKINPYLHLGDVSLKFLGDNSSPQHPIICSSFYFFLFTHFATLVLPYIYSSLVRENGKNDCFHNQTI